MTKYTAAMPMPSAPLVDPASGNITPAWWHWMLSLFARTGSAPGVGTKDVEVTAVAAGTGASAAQTTANGAATAAAVAQATASAAVKRAGDTMTGLLVLSGVPVAPLGAATKGYVDSTAPGLAPVQSVAGRTGAVTLGYGDISGLATVAHSGAYADLSGTPSAYVLPNATNLILGGVKVDNTTITASSGVISAVQQTIPAASSALPLVEGTANAGAATSWARGDHVHPAVAAYSLPTATNLVLGGVKPDGTTIANTAGAISVSYGTAAGTAAQGNDSRITAAQTAANVVTAIAAGNPGSFSTLAASSTVSGTGFSTYLASPPAIGGTAQAAGSFSTLTAYTSTTIRGAAGTSRALQFSTGASLRWQFYANATAEGGSNAGSDFYITRFADDGTTSLGTTFTINRSTGLVTMSSGAAITGGSVNNAPIGGTTASTGKFTTLQCSGNFAANGTAPAARPTITGSRGSATATVLASLLTAMAGCGLITDSTTA